MSFKQAFILAIKSLKSSKMRSFLTMLGIIIGVASVIILVSLGEGFSKNITDRFETLGANSITASITGRGGGNRSVKANQIMEFAEENPELFTGVTPLVTTGNVTVKYLNENITSTVIGSNEYYPEIRNVKISSGRYLEYVDMERRQTNCVIGSYIVTKFFQGIDPIGKEIKVNGTIYTIVGVAEAKASSTERSEDDRIYIPYNLAARSINQYVFNGKDKETIDAAVDKLNNFLYKIFSDTNAYTVSNLADMLDQVNEMTGIMTMFLVGIASIALVVGGIGIMNIMLVSVTERTREIGIRKSLGAKPWDIMSQFVVEAATTSSIGGIIGIILGAALGYPIGKAMQLTISPSVSAIILAFSVSFAIGMIFGYFPAKKASKLNPIDALRYD